VWDAATAAPIAVLLGHERPVEDAAFFPDGLRIASVSYDGTIRFWSMALRGQALIDAARMRLSATLNPR
jgi:WD40 repeat protein